MNDHDRVGRRSYTVAPRRPTHSFTLSIAEVRCSMVRTMPFEVSDNFVAAPWHIFLARGRLAPRTVREQPDLRGASGLRCATVERCARRCELRGTGVRADGSP